MGLDGIELVLGVEDHFGIIIRDAETERIRTVGDLVALIRSRICAAKDEKCPTRRAFLTLRRVVRETIDDETFRMQPQDAVALLAPRLRRRLWRRLPELLGTAPRDLRRPPFLRKTLTGISIALLVSAVALAAVDWRILPLTLFLAALLIFLLLVVTGPCCTVPPAGWVTMGDVARRIAGTIAAPDKSRPIDEEALLKELRPIIVQTLGVRESKVVMEARLVEDLGLS